MSTLFDGGVFRFQFHMCPPSFASFLAHVCIQMYIYCFLTSLLSLSALPFSLSFHSLASSFFRFPALYAGGMAADKPMYYMQYVFFQSGDLGLRLYSAQLCLPTSWRRFRTTLW
jgi:hypothetical protein